jgi:hypothetical protein
MRLGKALRVVMGEWKITRYRLSQVSGVPESALSRLVNEKDLSASWTIVEKLRHGFKRINYKAAVFFDGILLSPDSECPEAESPDCALPSLADDPEAIGELLEQLVDMDFFSRETLDAKREEYESIVVGVAPEPGEERKPVRRRKRKPGELPGFTLEQHISLRVQNKRIDKDLVDQEEETTGRNNDASQT